MKLCFRLCSGRYAPNSGKGAALYGGRWNPVGMEAIYTAQSAALATLEVLVHFSALPTDFVLTQIEIPSGAGILKIKETSLPRGWISPASLSATRAIGEAWLRENRYLVLNVPSSVLPFERNLILNPSHPKFSNIKFSTPSPFSFDPRLK